MASADTSKTNPAARKRTTRPFLESVNLITYTLVASAVIALVALFALQMSAAMTLLLHLGVLSVLTFFLFTLDKWRARKGKRRVSEGNLLLISALGGAIGGLLAMGILRHKRSHSSFMLLVPLFAMVHGVMFALAQWS